MNNIGSKSKTFKGERKQRKLFHLCLIANDNSHDNSINGDSLTENDADKILGPNSGGFDTSTKNTGSSCVDSPKKDIKTQNLTAI